MKVRAGFVSNSSSSSFIVFTGFTDQNLSDVMSNVQKSIINGIELSKTKLVMLQKLASDGNDVDAIKQMLNTNDVITTDKDTISLDLDTIKDLYDQMIKINNDEDLEKYVVNQFMKQDTVINDIDESVCIYKTKTYYSDEIDKICKYVTGYMNDYKITYPVYLFCESFDIDYYNGVTVEECSLVYNYCKQKKLMSIYESIGE